MLWPPVENPCAKPRQTINFRLGVIFEKDKISEQIMFKLGAGEQDEQATVARQMQEAHPT